MCGIAGWIDFTRDLREAGPLVRAMTDTLTARGPDAGDVWLDRHAGLGHRRLAVIDVAGGTQPMVVRDTEGRVRAAISYSGEVYNFRELRTELAAAGHEFTTRSDTEVVLRAHLEWGEAAVERLNGMFAYAVWDAVGEELLLVRDRLGIKPLYYAAGPGDGGRRPGGRLLFGSEPKAVLAHPGFTPELDAEGIAELFALPAAPTPGRAVYRGLAEVRPGTVVRFSRTGVAEHRYWRLVSRPHTDDTARTVDTVRELLADTVRRQLVSDVPLGLLLSGGLDSSTLTALAVGQRAEAGDGAGKGAGEPEGKTSTFSVDFPEDESPATLGEWNRDADAPYIRELVGRLGTAHTSVLVPGSGLLEHRDISLTARDWPGWGEPDTSLHLLFRGVRRHSTVALSGEVADEVFGGYPYFHQAAEEGTPTAFPWLRGRTGPAALLRPEVAEAVAPQAYAARRLDEALAEVPYLEGESAAERRIRETSYLALTRWLPALLERKDRMSMAAGLEVRVPFADHRLVEYLWNVPWEVKNLDGTPKGLLRRAVADLLPERVRQRPKSGYPASSAARYAAVLRERVTALTRRESPLFALVDRAAVVRALAEGTVLPGPRAAPHPTGGLDYLLALDSWLTRYEVRVR